MKKFMFTAIAMIAFAGSSMANTIEVEETTEKLNIEIIDETFFRNPKNDFCAIVADDVVSDIDPYGQLSYVDMHNLFQMAFSICYNFLP